MFVLVSVALEILQQLDLKPLKSNYYQSDFRTSKVFKVFLTILKATITEFTLPVVSYVNGFKKQQIMALGFF